jgi:hypothetical protein
MLALLVATLVAGQYSAPGDVAAPPPPDAAVSPDGAAEPSGPVDSVFFIGGGRVRGTVLEETARHDVTIRLLDGTVRRYTREEISRIEYADGSVSRRRAPPEKPRYAAPPPPQYSPPYPPPSRPPPPPAPAPYPPQPAAEPYFPVWGSIGLGGTFFGGDARDGVRMSETLEPQVHLAFDGGLRLAPEIGLGVYADVGGGDPGRAGRAACLAQGLDCTGTSGRFGFQFRYTFQPRSPAAKWLSIGTGWEFGSVTADGAGSPDVVTYTGRELVRLAGGIDLRSNAVIGVGLYGSFAWGEYDHVDDPLGLAAGLSGAVHTTTQVGVRFTLFP